jgi:hypothetical protein
MSKRTNYMKGAVAQITFPDETTMELKVKSELELSGNAFVGPLLPLNGHRGASLTFTQKVTKEEADAMHRLFQTTFEEERSVQVNKMLGRWYE